MGRFAVSQFLLLALAGCGGPGRLLVADLAGPSASVDLCDPGAIRSRAPQLDDSALGQLVDGLRTSAVEPALWRRCAARLLDGLPPPRAQVLLRDMGIAYRRLLRARDLGTSRHRREQLIALHQAFLERPHDVEPTPAVLDPLLADLRRAMAEKRLSAVAVRYGQDLLDSLDSLSKGRWQGQPVREQTLDALPPQHREAILRRFARRLPDPPLREAARRRILKLHLLNQQALLQQELGGREAEISASVLAIGHYPLPTDAFPLRRAIPRRPLPIAALFVRQDLARQRASILAPGPDGQGLAPTADLPLRDLMQLELVGLRRPVSLCPPPRREDIDLDVIPCVAPTALVPAHPLLAIDGDGTMHIAKDLDMTAATRLAASEALPLLFSLAPSRTVAEIGRLPLRFGRPTKEEEALLSFVAGGEPGAPGPALSIEAEHRAPQRIALSIRGAGRSLSLVLERVDLPTFRITTTGAAGAPGLPGEGGRPGRGGLPGRPARCPASRGLPALAGGPGGPGEPGGEGGHGGRGGPGGDGGEIVVRLRCGDRPCPESPPLLQGLIFSQGAQGGPGGPGGVGGPGGAGGEGGPGRTCTYPLGRRPVEGEDGGEEIRVYRFALPPGRDGLPGPSGPSGPPGAPGPPGRPGPVRFLED